MLPSSSASHLAEVLSSGLLVPAPEPASRPTVSDPPVLYEFHPGVRDLLRSSVQRSAGLAVLRLVTRHVTSQSGRPVDILALLDAPSDEGLTALVRSDRRFANIARSALRGLGGRYADVAERLGSQLDLFRVADVSEERWPAATMPQLPGGPRADAPDAQPVAPPGSWPATPRARFPVVAQPARGDEVSYPPSDRPGRARRSDLPAIWVGVPPRNPYFTGREDLLRDIHERLTGKVTALVPHALHGYGGVGKTHLAIEYVHRYQQEYNLVCWISAEQPAIVRTTIADLAKRMGLPSLTVDDAVRSVLTALRQNQPYDRWLLVFDNVNVPKDIEDFLPIGSGHIIVTSRSDVWTGIAQVVEVNVFLQGGEHRLSPAPAARHSRGGRQPAGPSAWTTFRLPWSRRRRGRWRRGCQRATTSGCSTSGWRACRSWRRVRSWGAARTDYPLPVAVTWSLALDRLQGVAARGRPAAAAVRLLRARAHSVERPFRRPVRCRRSRRACAGRSAATGNATG